MDVPKQVFDKEYSTQWRREVKFLEEKGINYVYAKRHNKYPVVKYKYTKTPELFLALAEFYNQVRVEKFFKDVNILNENCLEKGYIDINPDESERKLLE